MDDSNICKWIINKGPKKDSVCGKTLKSDNEFCYRHSKSSKTTKEDQISICSTIDIQKTKDAASVHDSISDSISQIENNDNDVLITKYFVFDCIKEYFRDHQEFNNLLSPKKENSSNMPMLLSMAGVGILPLILRNLTNLNIGNALHKQDNTFSQSGNIGTQEVINPYSTKQGTAEIIKSENIETEIRTHTTPTKSNNEEYRRAVC